MSKNIRYTLLSLRDLAVSIGPFALLTLALLALTYWWLDPNPPKRVVLATGPAQSAYDEFGKRYATALARYGITVELLPSEGSSANLELLRAGKADIGFVQGGSADIGYDDEESIVSLGSLFVEPLWLFYREDAAQRLKKSPTIANLSELQGGRVNVGTPGSGVPRLFNTLLDVNRIDHGAMRLSELEQTPATVAFLDGELDALVFASAPESLMVQMLLQSPGVRLLDFAQSEAYSRRFAYLTPVVMPQGVVDLSANVPAQDVRLVASTTSLLAGAKTHPAILQLFAQTATDLHGGGGWFSRAREYPSLEHSEVPLSPEAVRAIRNGPPFLQRYLPFWLANLVERMWLAMGLILALALPLSRIVPPLYAFRIRSRVFRWYGQLRTIEQRSQDNDGPLPLPELLEQLDALENKVEQVVVPLSYTDELYALRNNIALVRQKLLQRT
ncbi:MAG TPA: C4-dicarboxylate ABC transporter substrate-binding protein [Hydrogenophaga sp.]|uniref:TAXI family TRAP transporter solute-binding subunit n=1 Tax=Hydrogenophaga sp. TaxID=1904254 RepID=UPI0008B5E65D|nr:TAXI family TRAP transporter solute-binding subunit [Hydrogenophaga sp.]MBU4184033.1 ABC transporter substrate-binding protein [Gammaproteobacteria bacterium]OGA77898.1 MAG: C4-dicarboxylate ABC transporter substrate-binding protein [Burkholderiales bacterium GWE1_65_30]OGA94248.1 MAG: C4-dicarboxylate ABC transporter substrate-binding protein [Burkholderiales bacterium GWF1_66_17]PKO75065.1 MAG: C4-dicarboxylate ABC transporter substrate-binding protein [Betaproteobacteria bacterium HGW-Bet